LADQQYDEIERIEQPDWLGLMAANSRIAYAAVEGDYTGPDGFLVCGKCHTPKEGEREFEGVAYRTGMACRCRAEADGERRLEEERLKFESRMRSLRRDGITDPAYLSCTFANDDRRDSAASGKSLKYAENWDEMRRANCGIMFGGPVGTGKSFLACAIANALIDRCVPACVTSLPRLLNMLTGYKGDRQEVIDRLGRYALLVIDDLGAERQSSEFAVEQVFGVIDARARSGKPLIVTTNLTAAELTGPPTVTHKRIYDRVNEMCPVRILLKGGSRRVENAEARRAEAMRILEGG